MFSNVFFIEISFINSSLCKFSNLHKGEVVDVSFLTTIKETKELLCVH